MKRLIALFMFLLFAGSALAMDLNGCDFNNSDLNAIGGCIVRGSFSNEFFFSIILLLVFSVFMWQSRVPMGATLGITVLMIAAMDVMLGPYFNFMLDMVILTVAVLMVMGISRVLKNR